MYIILQNGRIIIIVSKKKHTSLKQRNSYKYDRRKCCDDILKSEGIK